MDKPCSYVMSFVSGSFRMPVNLCSGRSARLSVSQELFVFFSKAPVALSSLGRGLTFRIDPIRVQIGQGRLITYMLDTLRWLLIQQAAGSPPPPFLSVVHGCVVRGWPAERSFVVVGGEVDGPRNDQGRQLDGIQRKKYCGFVLRPLGVIEMWGVKQAWGRGLAVGGTDNGHKKVGFDFAFVRKYKLFFVQIHKESDMLTG